MIPLESFLLGQARIERRVSLQLIWYYVLKQIIENNLVNNNKLNISFKVSTGAASVSLVSVFVWDGCVSETL